MTQRFAWGSIVFLLGVVSMGRAADNMKAFPPADEGMARYVMCPKASRCGIESGRQIPMPNR